MYSQVVPVSPARGFELKGNGWSEENGAKQQIRLRDLSMVVIGTGPVAEEIVRKRVRAGGRVCWLWTDRPPQCNGEGDDMTDFFCRSSSERMCTWGEPDTTPTSASSRRHDEPVPSKPIRCAEPSAGRKGTRSSTVAWDLSTFAWKPPGFRHYQRQRMEAKLLGLQAKWGNARFAWRTSGPDILPLLDGEQYQLVNDSERRAKGIRIVDTTRLGGAVKWDISGAVIFAGSEFEAHADDFEVCVSQERVAEFDVDVLCEEAKPFATVRASHAAFWGALCFVQYVIFFVLMEKYESQFCPGRYPWWRAAYAWLSVPPFGFSSNPMLIGRAMTGTTVDDRVATIMSCLCTCGLTLCETLPWGWHSGKWLTSPMYVAQCGGFVFYLTVTTPLHFMFAKRTRGQQGVKLLRRAHACWFFWCMTGTFGTWLVLYGVALIYVFLSEYSNAVASTTMALLTSGVELFTVIVSAQLYHNLVYKPRMRAIRSKHSCATMVGDQKLTLMPMMMMTHAYAESTRLVGLLVTIVKRPSWIWLPQVLLFFSMNICLRSFIVTDALSRILPSSLWWLFAPDAGTVLHQEVKLLFGYPRFVSLGGLAVANIISKGLTEWPLFNMHATLLVLAAFILELLEDTILTNGFSSALSWRPRMASFYRGRESLEIAQVMGFDRDGVQSSGPAIGFSGMRFIPFRNVIVIMAPSCLFGYSLLSLLLGAGFVHKVCDTWISEDARLVDGLIWLTPLRC